MKTGSAKFFDVEQFVPSLREALAKAPLNLDGMIFAAVPVKDSEADAPPLPANMDRRQIILSDGEKVCTRAVDSLRAVFRGNQQPPVLKAFPMAYTNAFAVLETHVVEISELFGDRRDAEMKEIYSVLRRRPDGKSLGFVHDYMWQAAALMLATHPFSQAEFEAIVGRLEQSCRTFEMGAGSRNYVATLRGMFA